MDRVIRNWLVLAVFLGALSLLGPRVEGTGPQILVALGWICVGAMALLDGLCRVLGRSCFLGEGVGLGRLLAVGQLLLALLLLVGLLSALFGL